ncbi:putative calcium-binding protein CML23 [Benincasa hispida]|uniref:putative calcium-binding protein CML23 n=1 Tax=Benincasa hispida TaxID=102211 RepID=UPI00190061D3|nr:putative calcium-binding protein CML23 [Benincasa hispida]
MDKFTLLFNTIDTDCDGKVSPHDLLTRLPPLTGEDLTEVDAAAAVAAFDWNGDGLLDMEEFGRLVEGDDEEEVREAFQMYEMEGLGVITPVSLRRMLSRLGESRSVGDCKKMIAKFDVNGDGVLCFDEFRTMMLL